MKLRNKKTGYVWDIPKMRHPTAQEDDISFFAMQDTVGTLFSYKSLAELNEEWEDYEPTEKKTRRYRLIKDLPTFKAGEIFEIFDGNLYKINESDGDDTEYEVMAYHASTLKRFPNILEEWFELIEPKEPLIKDEKVRKAVRAWARANDIKYIEPCARLSKDNYRIVGFNALGRSFTMEISNEYECRITFGKALSRKERGAYTIAELCGEEEAPEPVEPTFIDLDERIKEKEEK